MIEEWDIVVVGSGNAALCAALAAREKPDCRVLVIEKATEELAGGNSAYTAGAMRFVYRDKNDLIPLLEDASDPRLEKTDFGSYTAEQFRRDLLSFNNGRDLSPEQNVLVDESYDTLRWLASYDVKFLPIYSRQSFEKDGRYVFWGGLTLEARNEGIGLVRAELDALKKAGGEVRYDCAAHNLIFEDGAVRGVLTRNTAGEEKEVRAKSVVLACGGFEANAELRKKYLGENWEMARVRGTPHNMGDGLRMALDLGAARNGEFAGCHATPMDYFVPEYGNLDIPHIERKHYRKICYFLGIMVNADGNRFVDEGSNFRNYTYAQFGRSVLEQPNQVAWQIFDAKVDHLLYEEYRFSDAHYVEADTLDALTGKMDTVQDKEQLRRTIQEFNAGVNDNIPFNPTVKDGRNTPNLPLPKSNWAQRIDTPPFKAYPVTGGITFTYGGVKVGEHGEVLHENGGPIPGLYACGEMVGGVFFNGYPGGSGLTSGAVFGRRAGYGAAEYALKPGTQVA